MPLSEEEQKILREIEAQLNATDPQLVDTVSRTTVYRHAGRNIKWAVAGFAAGLVLVVLSFASSVPLAFVGFLAMLGCAFVIDKNVRRLGRAGWQSLTGLAPRGLRGALGETGRAWRERFRRDR